ncbi:hypothetical protein VF14_06930 [Nostoc linckia z18]|uniref:Tandem-95 repeat protein n=8 Tax=Nostoc linckia TaxID=92942 RepID=A0A9Q5ZFZ9_NOSLI|nr:SdiA-regulated domain-containing protein [Nostoc linckia]PHJ84394.1 hypothetical protein VF06_09865 [Nostoc linckia z4]PHJ90974.1 hypothetical protein VF07_06605 [Nostoc linckia z6]PHJ99210.1 hypothetical protein VF04_07145 [Nostoc linckia z7]PHK06453.1 hypothetical protein VF08_04205 [Nostoc linckia z8]PHK11175.1 hypothetical protein VF09_08175 [Nostoc linckia z9]
MPAINSVDLSTYTLIGRYDLPEPTRTTAPPNSLLAQEVSAVTYNWDTDTLFVVGDGSTSIVQVTKTGELIDSMTLAPGNSPQGTDFYDTEGLTYIGGGKFVLIEERDRQANLFTYVPNTTLTKSDVQTVKLGTTVGNIGIEGISYDPLTSGFIAVKETQPQGIFQTNIDFAAGTATNGSPTTANSTDLFNPALANLLDFADVYALSNLSSLNGQADYSNLLVLSQESGKIVEIDRSGNIYSSLTIVSNPGNPLSVVDQGHEGLTMDKDGYLYVVSENGGGDINHPQLWVYAPSSVPNQAPTAIVLNNQVTAIAENTSTATRLKVADITITDDGLGTNNLTVTGTDANFFEVDSTGLYIKAGTVLDYETKTSYSVIVNVDDPTLGSTPDAIANFTLAVTDVVNETPSLPNVIISEVSPWSSSNSPYGADWFEVTNTGSSTVDITGWRIDDDSNNFANSVALNGVTSIAPGQSIIFIEGDATTTNAFKTAWFGSNVPSGFTIGTYSGSGIGLSTGGDAVNLFNAGGNRITGVSFGTSTTGFTFDNQAGLGSTTLPLPTVSTLSVAGVNGAFLATDGLETGSPGTIVTPPSLIVSEVSPWSSGNSPYGADWFEATNTGSSTVDITGWRIDDDSNNFANSVALNGVTSIAPGQSIIFIEGDATTTNAFKTAWFGSNVPSGFTIGTYSGSGIGLSTGGDAVNLFNASGNRITGVSFGTSTTGLTFDNQAGLGSTTLPLPTVSTLSVAGVNGAFLATDGLETGSPGTIVTLNQAPTAVVLNNSLTAIAENTSTTTRIKVADITVTDDALGTNVLSLSGADASAFEIANNVLYLKANTNLDFETKSSYAVNVAVDDADVGGTPDASTNFVLTVTNVNEAPTANNDSGFTANQSVAKVIPVATLLANDTDPDANTKLSILANGFSNVVGGRVTLNKNNVIFTPNSKFSGTASFQYTVSDGSLTSQAMVTIEVGRTVNDKNGKGILIGNGGDDNFTGGNGKDTLFGNAGNDSLLGGNGADILWGGEGDDLLNGGKGRDIFILSADSNGTDTIQDFNPKQDFIGLSGGLSLRQLTFVDVNCAAAILFGNDTLALLPGIKANQLLESSFIRV